MGEEEKKSEEGDKAGMGEEKKREEAVKSEEKKDAKKSEGPKAEEPAPAPAAASREIILKVYMHCEGCARKVRRCLKGFEGVEDVVTDCRSSKVVVKGEKADPVRILERIQKKSHRQVELISPIPKPPVEEPKKPEEKEVVKIEEKKEEPPVVVVVLGVYMHCEACAQEIKKRIQRMKGVENAEPDLKSSQVTVKGVFEPEKLVDYVHKRTGKQASIVKVDAGKKEEAKAKEDSQAKKVEGGGEAEAKKAAEDKENKKDSGAAIAEPPPADKPEAAETEDSKLDLKRNEFLHYYPQNYQVYPQRYAQDMYAYPPQIFSDENPNACSVM